MEKNPELTKTLNAIIKSNRDFNPDEFAQKLGITKSSLNKIVKGQSEPTLAVLLEFLNKSKAPKKLRKKVLLIHFQNQLTDPDHRQQIEDLIG